MKNKELKILLSAPRGFCAGVERAIEIVEKSIQKYGSPVYVRHEIVHNKFVVDDLKNKGAIFVEELEEIGDLLPTFFHTYKEYKKKLTTDLICCKSDISSLRKISSSRRSRRFRKIPYDFAKEIPTFEEIQQQNQQQTEENS